MPIIKSAMKRVRQEEKRRARNVATKRRIKAASKATSANIAIKDLKAAETSLKQAISLLDKAVKRGTLHKNTAARRKSKLTREYNGAAPAAYGTTKAATAKKTPAKKPATKKPAAK